MQIFEFGISTYLTWKFRVVYQLGPSTWLWGIAAELADAVIIFYQHPKWNGSFHFVAGIKVGGGVGGSYVFYNCQYYKAVYGNKPVSIWKYIDMLRKNGVKLCTIWGVKGKKGWW